MSTIQTCIKKEHCFGRPKARALTKAEIQAVSGGYASTITGVIEIKKTLDSGYEIAGTDGDTD